MYAIPYAGRHKVFLPVLCLKACVLGIQINPALAQAADRLPGAASLLHAGGIPAAGLIAPLVGEFTAVADPRNTRRASI